jgi:hypothetical protein
MDALVQQPAEILVALEEQDVLHAALMRGYGRGHSGRPAADDHEVFLNQAASPP